MVLVRRRARMCCPLYVEEREQFVDEASRFVQWNSAKDDEARVAWILGKHTTEAEALVTGSFISAVQRRRRF